MKQTVKYVVATLCVACLSMSNVWAVAPLPGLGLTEPIRKPIPQGIVHQQHAARAAMEWQAPELVSRGLLIVVEFADTPLSAGNTVQSFDSLANADDYTYNGAMGSCKKYFQDQSDGQYTPQFDVVGPVVLPQSTAYYGTDPAYSDYDRYIADFVIDACKGAQAMGVDFANYDQNGDGNVDLVYIIYAGYSQADGGPATSIWPHAWDVQSALYYGYTNQNEYYVHANDAGYITAQNLPVLNGKTILRYACSNELIFSSRARTSIGTICHEFAHVLGLPDYYLTTTTPITQQRLTPGAWSLMGLGNYLNNGNTPPNLSVYDKYFLGWLTPTVLDRSQSLTIPADGATTYMLTRNQMHSEEGAYRTDTAYYIENRQKEGWDAYLPGHGMLIWRVMYDKVDWYNNCPNDYVARYLLVSAKSTSSPYTTGKEKPEVPFPGSSMQTKYEPFKGYNGLYNIQETNGVITCDFTTTNNTTDVEMVPVVDQSVVWYNLLGQPVDIQSYKGIAVSKQGKVLVR